MERTKKSEELVTWKKLGGGVFYMKNRIIKPGQIFKARLSDIPESAKDIIVPVDPKEVEKQVEKKEMVEEKPMQYEIVSRSAGYYNVVDADGKVQNEKALRKEPALELLATLTGE